MAPISAVSDDLAASPYSLGDPLFEAACAEAAVGMCLLTPEGRFLRVNRAFCELLGYSQEELLATDFPALTHSEDREKSLDLQRRLLNGEIPSATIEKRYLHRTGRPVWVQLTTAVVREPEAGPPRYFISQMVDISERKYAEARIRELAGQLEEANRRLRKANLALRELAATDPLTGVANRRELDERLVHELQRAARTGEPISLLFLDLDRFKQFNDRFGHPAGDELLVRLGGVLARSVRTSDGVARFGGEEFVVLLPDTDAEGARTLAEKLRLTIRRHLSARARVTVSVGAATARPPAGPGIDFPQEARRLLSEADRALYEAKRAGRDRATHAADLDRRERR